MTPQQIEACWRDLQNRKWGLYYCKADPRVIVPKHIKWMGWTVNAARPSALPVTFALLAMLIVPVNIAIFKGAGTAIVLFTAAASITIVCLLCAYLASSKRWSH
jgi:hypothetical protein